MKNSYELAMERLKENDPTTYKPLTDEQKEKLRVIDANYAAKMAEKEIFLQKKLADALAAGEFQDADQIKNQLRSEKTRLEEERDEEKSHVRSE